MLILKEKENISVEFKKKSFVLKVENLKDQQYIFEINSLPEEISLMKKNKATVHKGNIVIELFKKHNKKWKEFIKDSHLNMKEASFDVKSSQSDISEEFFMDTEDEELQREMNKLIFESMQA